MDRPLISYILISYNQEDFIREAVESALSQSYSPLEIIISDDHSEDGTFEMARETAAGYKGPHSVRLNRNPINLGLGGNVNRAMELCRGEFVVCAAGDDVSLPERTEVIYQAWNESGRKATSIFSSYSIISRDGCGNGVGGLRSIAGDCQRPAILKGDLLTFLSQRKPVVNGCTHCWSPSLFKYFGPLKCDLEDLLLSFRTLAIGTMLYINTPLVKYRRHGGNVSFLAEGEDPGLFEHREKRLRWVDESTLMACDNMLLDIENLFRKGRINAAYRDRLTAEARRIRSFYRLERDDGL